VQKQGYFDGNYGSKDQEGTLRKSHSHHGVASGAGAAELTRERGSDERLVDRAVAHLQRLIVAGQVETYGNAGEYLIKNFYGSVENARSRRADKPASLSRLAERAHEFGMTPSTLGTAVQLALVVRDVGAALAGQLGVSRLRALAPLQEHSQRRLVGETAAAAGWTVEKVKERVRKIARPHAGGRPEQPGVERAVTRIAKVVDAEATPERLRASLDTLTAKRAKHLLARVNQTQASLERIEKTLQGVLGRAVAGA